MTQSTTSNTHPMPILDHHSPIGWIGTGVMGKSLVLHLLKAGYCVHVYNRTKQKAEPLLQAGAQWCSSIADIAQSNIIFTMLGFPQDVEEVYLAPHGLLANAKPNTILCDFTTSEPSLACKIAQEAAAKAIYTLDAPVSGGDKGAREGTLAIMVGGPNFVLEHIQPILVLFGRKILHVGPAGAGQHTKMANQIMIAGTVLGMLEGMLYAEHAGLDMPKVLDLIGSGAAASWSLANYAPRILQGDFQPGFFIKHFVKDMKIAQQESQKMHLDLQGLMAALAAYEEALSEVGNLGVHGLYSFWKKQDKF